MTLPRILSSSKSQSAIAVALSAVALAVLGLVTGREALAAIVLAATGYMLSTGYEDGQAKRKNGG